MKVGDLVMLKGPVQTTFGLMNNPTIGVIKSKLNNNGYYDVMLHTGQVIFVGAREIDLIGKLD